MKFSMKKVFSVIVLGILLLFNMTACNTNEETSQMESSNLSESTENKEETSSELDKNETGVAVGSSVISWANMEVDQPDLNLTEDQKEVLRYFDSDYFEVYNYESLQKYPEIYRNAQISFAGTVIKMLETDDETYQCLVWMNGYLLDGVDELVQPTNEEFVVVSGKHPDDGRIIEGDWLEFCGRYIDVKSFDIDGKQEYYPYVTVNYTVGYGAVGPGSRFDFEDIERVAKIIFGENIKIKKPICGEDYELDRLHHAQYCFYLVTPDNQSNANFSRFEFSCNEGMIRDANSTEEEERRFFVSADFQHYIVTVYDRNLDLMYLEYYDRNFQKLWGREIEGIDTVSFDYTSQNIYLVADNDFYVIDTETGEDKIAPVMVGEKVKISVVKDGIIMIGTGNNDNIMKTDFEGNIIWKTSADIEVESCQMIQIIDGTMVADLLGTSSQVDHYVSKMVAVDSEGNIISEFFTTDF